MFLVLSQKEAFGGGIGPKGEVWSTYSTIGQHVTHYVFKAALNSSFRLKPSHLGSARLVSACSHAASVFLNTSAFVMKQISQTYMEYLRYLEFRRQ